MTFIVSFFLYTVHQNSMFKKNYTFLLTLISHGVIYLQEKLNFPENVSYDYIIFTKT